MGESAATVTAALEGLEGKPPQRGSTVALSRWIGGRRPTPWSATGLG